MSEQAAALRGGAPDDVAAWRGNARSALGALDVLSVPAAAERSEFGVLDRPHAAISAHVAVIAAIQVDGVALMTPRPPCTHATWTCR
jgi:hypothetical protein